MKEPIQKYFQVGTIQWMTHPPVSYPVCDSVRTICCDPYFGALEITHIPDNETRERVKKMLDQSHLRVYYGAQPNLLGKGSNPNRLEETERRTAEEELTRAVDEAAYMGAGDIAFLAGKRESDPKEQAYPQLLKTTRAVCTHAAKEGMMMELEVFNYDMDKAALTGPASLAARFTADMGMTHHNSGLLADLPHFPTTHETSRYVVRTLRPYITHFHIGNAVVKEGCKAYGDQRPGFGFPKNASDTEQLTEFFRVLKEEGFFNEKEPYVLSLGVKSRGDEGGEITLADTKRVINRAWAMVED